jgi:putative ABC transport system permease protein
MKFTDIFSLAYATIKTNRLRTGITIGIIALGIFAIIGINTAITALKQKLTESFSTMGASAFTIRFKQRQMHFGGGGDSDLKLSKKGKRKEKTSNLDKPITMEQAEAFRNGYSFPATVGVYIWAGRNAIVSYEKKKTTPNVMLLGCDENYLLLNSFTLSSGRNFSKADVQSGRNYCLIGQDIVNRLFKENPQKAVNTIIRVNDLPFIVLGILGSRGSSFGFSRDNIVLTSYKNVDRNFSNNSSSYTIAVMTDDINQTNNAMGEAEGQFRSVRRLNITEESNFVIDRNDAVIARFFTSLNFITTAASAVGFITLLGAAIALMNIMLVAVNERTREVGLIKAIGGKKKTIRQQFLSEAVLISLFGAALGIVLGVLGGNIVSILVKTNFVVPWGSVLKGIFICTLVGLAAGIYPAFKAGKLNPIDALRYE